MAPSWEQEVWTPETKPQSDDEERPHDPPGLELELADLLPIDVRGGMRVTRFPERQHSRKRRS